MRKVSKRALVSILGTAILAVAGVGFSHMFLGLASTIGRGELAGFALAPVVSYLIMGLGVFLLVLWSALSGHLKDIEEPKFRMLKRELSYQAKEGEINFEHSGKEDLLDD